MGENGSLNMFEPGIPGHPSSREYFRSPQLKQVELKQATDVTTTTGSLVHVLDVRMQIRQLLPSAVRIPMSRGVHVRQLFLDGLRGQ